MKLLRIRPRYAMIPPNDDGFRDCLFEVASEEKFEIFILGVILLNTIFLAVQWPTMTESEIYTLECINYIFLAIFILEAIVKLLAFGCRYFKDNWNVLDFFIVTISVSFKIAEKTAGVGFGTIA